jgi:hypothetical protein
MTSLSGEFQTDLPLPDALTACVEAVDGLGWEVESVEPNLVSARTRPEPATISVELAEADGGTDLRLTCSDGEEEPLGRDGVIVLLERARDAIGEQIEQADEPDEPGQEWVPQPGEESDRETEPTQEAEPDEDLPPAGWFPDPDNPEGERYWDGEEWTNHVRSRRDAKAVADARRQEPDWWQRNRRSVAVGAIALLIGGGIGAAASGDESGTVRAQVKTRTVQGPVRVRTQVQTVTDTRTVRETSTTTVPPAGSADGGSPAPGGSGGTGGGNCHPSYAPQCLDASAVDYDCQGGGGDGPQFVAGPVTVVGPDDYGLDGSDNDGLACE